MLPTISTWTMTTGGETISCLSLLCLSRFTIRPAEVTRGTASRLIVDQLQTKVLLNRVVDIDGNATCLDSPWAGQIHSATERQTDKQTPCSASAFALTRSEMRRDTLAGPLTGHWPMICSEIHLGRRRFSVCTFCQPFNP